MEFFVRKVSELVDFFFEMLVFSVVVLNFVKIFREHGEFASHVVL